MTKVNANVAYAKIGIDKHNIFREESRGFNWITPRLQQSASR